MSLFLYRWGGFVRRHAWWIVGAWAVMLAGSVLAVGATGRQYDDSFSIPGSESQEGMSVLTSRFPQAAGASGQIMFTVPEGEVVTEDPYASEIERIVSAASDVEQVASVSDPVSPDGRGVVSPDGRSALAQVQFTVPNVEVEPFSLDGVEAAAQVAAGSGAADMEVLVGGTAYAAVAEHSRAADIIGIVAAFFVLLVTFGSFVAAGMPLATAIVGVLVTDCLIGAVSLLTPVNSTAPTLAVMIGLAVGIDYALFILSRHRRQLSDGVPPAESIARALGTAGTAVVFAGVTVIIALCGLAVADIPFLTVMGLCAAAGVAASVLVSLTLLPAMAALLGSRLKPRARRRRRRRAPRRTGLGFAQRWVRLIIRHPLITVVTVVIALGTLAVPAFSLSLSLADNGSAPSTSNERATYDAVAAAFGPGYNAPLLIVGNVITSTDPRGDVAAFADDISRLQGVYAVGQATPNEGGDTALIQVIPEGSQSSESTIALVQTLRDEAPALGVAHNITGVQVTGQTAVSIDVSSRLAAALLPFGLVVVGLSLVLLTVVFRSIVVPLKATLGYVLSVGVSFGVVAAVFNRGWGAALLGVEQTGPVISFLPIIVMGVLFGLAMDYEVFLVSRIREHYTKTGDARGAIEHGFTASAPVVTAAGIIMVSVFTAFIPTGSATIKPIALALAVGVFVDAFVVRMTLVPAVLALLGEKAWWLPRSLERVVPSLDIEGAAVEHALDIQSVVGRPPLVARRLETEASARRITLLVPEGEVAVVDGVTLAAQRILALTVTGRIPPIAGEAAVDGMITTDQPARVQSRSAVFDASVPDAAGTTIGDYVAGRLRNQASTGIGARRRADAVLLTAAALLAPLPGHGAGQHPRRSLPRDTSLVGLSWAERFAIECALADHFHAALVVVIGLDDVPVSTQRRDIAHIARQFATRSRGVLMLSDDPVLEAADLGIQDAGMDPDMLSHREVDTAPAPDSHESSEVTA